MFYLCSLPSLIALFVLFSKVNCESFVHTAGNRHFFGQGEAFHDGWLFNKTTEEPTSYALSYKYTADSFSGIVTYVELGVIGAENSSAEIDLSKNIDSTESRFVDATANIVNTTSLTTRIGIKGFDGINSGGFDALANILHRMRFKRRSIAVLCATHPTEHTKRQKRIIEYGQRSASDAIVRFQKETVAASSANYPKFTFDFSDPYVNITYVALTMTTPGTIVFTNKVLFADHQFRATIYELNKQHFSTEMIIYGIRV